MKWAESEKRREEKKEHQKRESLRRKKIQVREKVGQLRNTVFSQWFVAFEGRKVGSLKRRVRSYVVRWEMKSCTRLWRKAIVETSATALCGTTGISIQCVCRCILSCMGWNSLGFWKKRWGGSRPWGPLRISTSPWIWENYNDRTLSSRSLE